MADIPPSQTIYVNNLNEKIKKPQLKKALYSVRAGAVLGVV